MLPEEVRQLESIVIQTLQEIDTTFQVTVGAADRRGAKDSGDIDPIITKPDANLKFIQMAVLDPVVPALSAKDFLKAALGRTNKDAGMK